MCSEPCETVILSNPPDEVAQFIGDPRNVMQVALAKTREIEEFQQMHRESYVIHLGKSKRGSYSLAME